MNGSISCCYPLAPPGQCKEINPREMIKLVYTYVKCLASKFHIVFNYMYNPTAVFECVGSC